MFNTDLDALIPMLCITLTALATMGTEAFRGRSERLPIGWWGLIGLGGAATQPKSADPVEPGPAGSRQRRADWRVRYRRR